MYSRYRACLEPLPAVHVAIYLSPWTRHMSLNHCACCFLCQTCTFARGSFKAILNSCPHLLWPWRVLDTGRNSRHARKLTSAHFWLKQTNAVARCMCLHVSFLHIFVLWPYLPSAKPMDSAHALLSCSAQDEKACRIQHRRRLDACTTLFFFLTRAHTYPARELRLCPAAWLPKATTPLPAPRYRPVESHLWVLWGKGGESRS